MSIFEILMSNFQRCFFFFLPHKWAKAFRNETAQQDQEACHSCLSCVCVCVGFFCSLIKATSKLALKGDTVIAVAAARSSYLSGFKVLFSLFTLFCEPV